MASIFTKSPSRRIMPYLGRGGAVGLSSDTMPSGELMLPGSFTSAIGGTATRVFVTGFITASTNSPLSRSRGNDKLWPCMRYLFSPILRWCENSMPFYLTTGIGADVSGTATIMK